MLEELALGPSQALPFCGPAIASGLGCAARLAQSPIRQPLCNPLAGMIAWATNPEMRAK